MCSPSKFYLTMILKNREPISREYVLRALGDMSEIENLWYYSKEVFRCKAKRCYSGVSLRE